MTKASDQRDASTSVDEKVQKKARQLRLAIAFLVGAAVLAAFLLATGVLTLRPMFGDGLAPWRRSGRLLRRHAPDDSRRGRGRKRIRPCVLPQRSSRRDLDGRDEPRYVSIGKRRSA